MHNIARVDVKQDILQVAITQPKTTDEHKLRNEVHDNAYPRMNPTIDMTAIVRLYASRLLSHAVGSGNWSRNH
jgi:hypothetical protein